ncbi:kinesin-like protein KIF [Acrasis kona]|uniref:Kinesin-like protein n=1 Tax=Acrasis kona TaxID=1008807 RepID=A0AAW2Z5D8_9EUKA
MGNCNSQIGQYYSVAIKQPGVSKSQRMQSWSSTASFDKIFNHLDNNLQVYKDVVAESIPKIMSGDTCNFFAYGHTGSGKTHTIVGYNHEDPQQIGLVLSAARDLFGRLKELNSQNGLPAATLAIGLRMYEVRKKSAYDLLNARVECFVREGPDGKTHVRGETEILEGGRVRVRPIVMIPCWTFDEFRKTFQTGLNLRATGTSTVHDKSSRTHAIFELEIVNQSVVKARDAIIERQAELVPHGKYATDVYIEEHKKGLIQDSNGGYILNPNYTINQNLIDLAEAKKREYEKRVEDAEQDLKTIFHSCSHSCLGGKFIFVDLAGSEYYNQESVSSSTGK